MTDTASLLAEDASLRLSLARRSTCAFRPAARPRATSPSPTPQTGRELLRSTGLGGHRGVSGAASAIERAGPELTHDKVVAFAEAARHRMGLSDDRYRRDHLRAVAQRIEVSKTEARIIGSRRSCSALSPPSRA